MRTFFLSLILLAFFSASSFADISMSEKEWERMRELTGQLRELNQQQEEQLRILNEQLTELSMEIDKQQRSLRNWKRCSMILGTALIAGAVTVWAVNK